MVEPSDYLTEDVRVLMTRLTSTLSGTHNRHTSIGDTAYPKLRHTYKQSLDVDGTEKRTISSKEFIDTTYRRMQNYELKKEQAREAARIEAEGIVEAEKQQFRDGNQARRSASTAELPISARFQKVIEDQNLKRKELCEKVLSEREEKLRKELTFTPEITPKSARDKMTPDEFFAYNQKWLREAKESREVKRIQEMQKELAILTHSPALNAVSKKITSKPQYRTSVQTRFSEFDQKRGEKLAALRKSLQPSFHPEISPKSQKLARKANTPPAFARLYTPKRQAKAETREVNELDEANAPTLFFNIEL